MARKTDMRMIVLPAAKADLIEIGDYIAVDNPARAMSFIAEIEAVIFEKIADRPTSYPARPELAPGLRAARHGRYLIFFLLAADRIEIVRVLHGSRDLGGTFGG